MVDDQFVYELRGSLRRGDSDEVDRLCARFVADLRSPNPPSVTLALVTLRELQEHRRLTNLPDVAESALVRYPESDAITHRYALALLDAGRTVVAERLLLSIDETKRRDNPDVRGALARVFKERFLAAADSGAGAAALAAATRTYHETYLRSGDHGDTWTYHGVNAAALLTRAGRDGVQLDGFSDPAGEARTIARRIVEAASADDTDDAWLAASAAEAALCLDDHALAFRFLTRYLGAGPRAFAINSTLNQLWRLWRLEAHSNPGGELIALLEAQLIAEEGRFTIRPRTMTHAVADRLVGAANDVIDQRVRDIDSLERVSWMARGLAVSRSVVRIEAGGRTLGTGFVVSSSFFGSPTGWPDLVVVTARHVVDAAAPTPLRLRGASDAGEVVVDDPEQLWIADQGDTATVDACVLALPLNVSLQPLEVCASFPDVPTYIRLQRKTIVMGHGHGSELVVSLTGSSLFEPDPELASFRGPEYAWYLTSATDGISGGPVFDDNWTVMIVHRGWDPSARANVGVRMDRLREAVGRT